MAQLTITRLEETEIGALIQLAYRIWHAHYPGIITPEQIDYMLERGYTPQIIRDEINHQGVAWLAIKSDGEMIGFASVGPHAPRVMKLHKLYLLPEFHGTGIGAQTLTEIERIARNEAATALVLNVNRHNAKAINAYQRAGWQVSEEAVVDIGHCFVMDDFIMTKQLV